MLQRSLSISLSLCLVALGCGDDGGEGSGSTSGSTQTSDGSTGGSSSGDPTMGETSSGGGGSSSSGGGSSSSGGGSSSSGGETDTDGAQSITILGSFVEYPAGSGVADAQVCWSMPDTPEVCTTTDGGGMFTLEGVPANAQGAVTVEDDQVVGFAMVLRTGTEDIQIGPGFGIDSPEVQSAYFDQAGVEPMKGGVTVTAQLQPAAAGYALELSPSMGDGPYYYGATPGEIDPLATETAGSGVGVFLNVMDDDGGFDIAFTSGDMTCDVPSLGLPLESWRLPPQIESVFIGLSCD